MIINMIKLSRQVAKIASTGVVASVVAGAALPAIDKASPSIDLGTLAVAQAKGCENFKPPKRRLPAFTNKMLKTMEPINALVSPQPDKKTGVAPEPNFKAAMPRLEKVLKRCEGCNQYELGQIYNIAAYTSYSLERTGDAIKYYKKVLEQAPVIPWALEQQAMYTVAQLLMMSEKYKESLSMFDKWEKTCPSPMLVGADYFSMRAQIYYQIGDKKSAMASVSKAITMYETAGKIPKEGWYRLKLALFAEKEDYKNAVKVMEKMIPHYGSKTNWTQLAGLYGLTSRPKEQLGVLDAVDLKFGIDKSSYARNYAFLLLGEEAPYPAAKVLKKYLDKKVIERTSKNLESLASAYRMSQEVDDSIKIMEEAAKKSGEGKIYANLAAIYLDGDKFKESIAAAKKALEKGKLRGENQVSQVHLYRGVAHLNLKQYDSCVSSLSKVKAKRYKANASQLINYCRSEKERERKLKASQVALKKDK